jgi:hypothetical protein
MSLAYSRTQGVFQVNAFFIENLVFRVAFLCAGLFSLGTHRYPCYLYDPDGNGFRLSCRHKEKFWGRSLLRLAA